MHFFDSVEVEERSTKVHCEVEANIIHPYKQCNEKKTQDMSLFLLHS